MTKINNSKATWERAKEIGGKILAFVIPAFSLIAILISLTNSSRAAAKNSMGNSSDSPEPYQTDYNWNATASTWEKNGTPAAYRVTWRDVHDGSKSHSMDFKDIDTGYDYYQYVRKTPGLYGAVWEHIYPDSE